MNDSRNVTDEFKGLSEEDIKQALDKRGVCLEIAIENLTRDFNMGTIVRSANAFGVRTVHIIGSKQWNKRGAMMTDKYLNVVYHADIESFIAVMKADDRRVVCIDNVHGSEPLSMSILSTNDVFVFGAEGPGISSEMLLQSDAIIAIEQLGSTRSVNVGVAAGIAMYEWVRRHVL